MGGRGGMNREQDRSRFNRAQNVVNRQQNGGGMNGRGRPQQNGSVMRERSRSRQRTSRFEAPPPVTRSAVSNGSVPVTRENGRFSRFSDSKPPSSKPASSNGGMSNGWNPSSNSNSSYAGNSSGNRRDGGSSRFNSTAASMNFSQPPPSLMSLR